MRFTVDEFVKVVKALVDLDYITGYHASAYSDMSYPQTPDEIRNAIALDMKFIGIKTYDHTRLTDESRNKMTYHGGDTEFNHDLRFKLEGTGYYIWAYVDMIEETGEIVLLLGHLYNDGKIVK